MQTAHGVFLLISLYFFALTGEKSFAAQDQTLKYVQIITLDSQAQLNKVLELFRSGQDFAELAREYSTHHSAAAGGYWGPISDRLLAGKITARLAGAAIGEVFPFGDRQFGPALIRKVDSELARREISRLAMEMGNRYLKQGQGTKALEAFKTAVFHQPQMAQAHFLLGYTYRYLASYEMIAESKAELRQAISLDPHLSWARFYLARIYLDLGRLKKARDELEHALQQEAENPFFLALLGEVHRRLENPYLSLQLNGKALKIAPSLSLAHYYLGLALAEVGNGTMARQELEIAVGCAEVIPEMHLSLGSVYSKENRFDEAIDQFKRALQLDPTRAESRLNLAKAYRLAGKFDLAQKELKSLRKNQQLGIQSPYFQDICTELDYEEGMLHLRKGRTIRAKESFLEAIRFKQTFAPAHRQLAMLLAKLGEYTEALTHAKRAEELGSPLDAALFDQILEKASVP